MKLWQKTLESIVSKIFVSNLERYQNSYRIENNCNRARGDNHRYKKIILKTYVDSDFARS